MFHEYEIVFIIRPDIDDAATNTAIERVESIITDNGGHLLERDDWGKRKLAYNIKKHSKGHYVLVHFAAKATLIAELERKLRIDDSVIRFLTVKLSEDVDVENALSLAAERAKEAAEKAAKEAAEAAAAAEAAPEAAAE